MADEVSSPAPPSDETPPETTPPQAPIPFNIGEEFGTAKRNLPPAKIVLIALAVVLVIVGVYSMINRAHAQGSGQIDGVVAAEVPGQNSVLVAITLTLRNSGEKPLWIHNIKAELKTASGTLSDDAASAVDFDRYFQAFPTLKAGAQPAISPETKLQPGAEVHGTILVGFPVNQQGFDQRQAISAILQPYDQPVPVVLTK
jgi:hypothetical protein